jgi:hypothetical protein
MVRHVETKAISLQIHNLPQQKISCTTAYTYSQLSSLHGMALVGPLIGRATDFHIENVF